MGQNGQLADGLDKIASKWAELASLTDPLPDVEFMQPRADGWSPRDHVVHVTAWERSLLALLRGESRAAAVGLTDEEHAAFEIDEINARIIEQAANLSPAEVRRRASGTHAEVLTLLHSLTDEDVKLPYSHYQPTAGSNGDPVFNWIGGNTFGHYEEHIGWLTKSTN